MQEQLISFETAKLAKKKGFDIPQNKMYSIGSKMFSSFLEIKLYDGNKHECSIEPYNWNDGADFITRKYYSAPTQSLLHKWLRDIHQIHVVIQDAFCMDTNKLKYYPVLNPFGVQYDNVLLPKRREKGEYIYLGDVWREVFEEALEIGLLEALKLI